ncbi:uroporphyrinogen-III synthase [Aquibium microcysteis]|uniref:uroporphyrinogen-III synthase n=1 Tax=Aquibium microcysteis TaxID=675281 RepID=UPI00165CF7BB|nr:uroporphyrinogen-III synthase [Aquibium microcysteis]
MVRVLVTRPEPGATATARRLAAAGHEPILLPLSETRALPAALPPPDAVDVVAVTSANALRHLPAVPAALLARPCYAVGGRTAQAARGAGFGDVRAAAGDGAALAAMIAGAEPAGATVLYLCGRIRRPEFEHALGQAGFAVRCAELYDTVFVEPGRGAAALGPDRRPIDAVLLYSPETARAMAGVMATDGADSRFGGAAFLCLSARVAAALGTVGRARTYVAVEPTEDALLALLPSG